ncbi:LamG-like jellyroll fold domain-containing protein [Pedosphaera parvula]|nr:LamG-like jellyroll fold domain-containing protein [Pedosphaera parvula]
MKVRRKDASSLLFLQAACALAFLCALVNSPAQSCVAPPSGLVAWWAGDGDASDSQNGNNGTLFGGTNFATGEVSQAFSFDGTSQYIRIPSSSSLSPTGSFTLEAWIYPQAPSISRVIIGKWGGSAEYANERSYVLDLTENNALQFCISDAAHEWDPSFHTFNTTDNAVPLNTWSHVVGVYDQTTGTRLMYINGMLVATRTDAPINIWNGIAAVGIGARMDTTTQPANFFAGKIDEVSLYNRALSVTEIQSIFNAGSAGKCKTPLPPSISSQPQSQTVNAGANVSFNVTTSGTAPLSYQWQMNGTNLVAATTSVFNLSNVQLSDAGVYTVIITNLYGAVVSSNATLFVNAFPPSITTQPQSQTVNAGANVSFEVVASGSSPLNYQWQLNGSNVPGATTSTLTLSNVQPVSAGDYTIVVTNPYGLVTSSNATLVINTYPAAITTQPQSLTLNVGENGSLTVVASGTAPLTYQWQFNGTNLAGATLSFLSLLNVQTNTAGSYSVTVANPYGSTTSSNSILTVNVPICQPAPNGILAWWAADGDASDLLNVNNGTLFGGVGFATGEVAQAFSFNGSSQYVRIPSSGSLSPTGSLTLEAWIYPQAQSIGRVIIGKWGGAAEYAAERSYVLDLTANNALQFGISDAAHQGDGSFHTFNSPDNAVALNTWSHVAGVYDQTTGTRRMYVNGVLVATRTDAPINVWSGIAAIGIGARMNTTTQASDFFAGKIDEVSLYGRALAESEIQAIYNSGVAGKCKIPIVPSIVSQPRSQTVTVGTNVTFSVVAAGTAPFSYQWISNDTNVLVGATNSSLVLSNVQLVASGTYSVIVSNSVGSILSSNATLTVNPPPALVQVVSVTASSNTVQLPINLVANGNENALGFSLNWNASLLHFVGATIGTGGSGGSLLANTNQINSGHLGLAISLSANSTFTAGTQNVLIVTFSTSAVSTTTSNSITFGDTPTLRQLVNPQAVILPATYANGGITIPFTGYEGDVTPLPNGDRNVTIADWVQEGRFVAGLDAITNSSIYQRADAAPRSTQGDGIISVSDWVQVGRYAAGLDALSAAGGPTQDAGARPATIHVLGLSPSALTIANASVTAGQTCQLSINLESQGDEAALGFSVDFDPAFLTLTGATLGSGASGATLNLNTNQAGRVGIALAMPITSTFAAGTREVVKLNFKTATNATGNTTVSFTNRPVFQQVSDPSANTVSTTYVNGSVSFTQPVVTSPLMTVQQIANSLVLSWPGTAGGFHLEGNDTLTVSNWTSVSATFTTNGSVITATVPISGTQKFYRLHYP